MAPAAVEPLTWGILSSFAAYDCQHHRGRTTRKSIYCHEGSSKVTSHFVLVTMFLMHCAINSNKPTPRHLRAQSLVASSFFRFCPGHTGHTWQGKLISQVDSEITGQWHYTLEERSAMFVCCDLFHPDTSSMDAWSFIPDVWVKPKQVSSTFD